MKSARTVHNIGLFKSIKPSRLIKNSVLFVFLAAGLMSCANQSNVEYLYLNNQVLDTEWGHTGSEARMEVTQRVSVEAASMLEEDTGLLKTEVTVSNASIGYMRLLYRGCPVQIQVFDNEKREGEPVFDSFAEDVLDCSPRQVVRTLYSLEDLRISELTHTNNMFSESAPDGLYYITAVVRPNGVRIDVPAGEIELGS